MGLIYEKGVRRILFALDSERAHEWGVQAMSLLGAVSPCCWLLEKIYQLPPATHRPVEAFGLKFPNAVGLAAGFDKNARAWPAAAAMGFGHVEIGTVTALQQPGNPKPRMFRFPREEAVINRMGFNNPGAEEIAHRLANWRAIGRWPDCPVGINLGKSKTTPLEQAPEDYAKSLRVLQPYADFFVVNVSSPNTPNLRQLQDKTALDEILAALHETNNGLAKNHPTPRAALPILVKVAPDLSFEALDEILELAGPRQLAGIVATNTTITRPTSDDSHLQKIYSEAGGLSGRPLSTRSTEIIRHIRRQTRGRLPIIGVGGIFNADDAWEKIIAGASLVQLYTGLVFEGPGAIRKIVDGLRLKLKSNGFDSLSQAVGSQSD